MAYSLKNRLTDGQIVNFCQKMISLRLEHAPILQSNLPYFLPKPHQKTNFALWQENVYFYHFHWDLSNSCIFKSISSEALHISPFHHLQITWYFTLFWEFWGFYHVLIWCKWFLSEQAFSTVFLPVFLYYNSLELQLRIARFLGKQESWSSPVWVKSVVWMTFFHQFFSVQIYVEYVPKNSTDREETVSWKSCQPLRIPL